MKCETCIYRKNCQFLAKHKKAEVIGCDAFVSEIEFVKEAKAEAVREFAERLKEVFVTIDGTFECSEVEEHIDALVNELVENSEQGKG